MNGKRLACFGWFLIGLFLSIVNWNLIITIGNKLRVWETSSFDPKTVYQSFEQLIILYPIIGEYILISLTVIFLVAMIKGGLDKLKRHGDYGLIDWLIVGLIVGLIYGLFFGLIVGIFFGLIVGQIVGLFFGLIFGLRSEFD